MLWMKHAKEMWVKMMKVIHLKCEAQTMFYRKEITQEVEEGNWLYFN